MTSEVDIMIHNVKYIGATGRSGQIYLDLIKLIIVTAQPRPSRLINLRARASGLHRYRSWLLMAVMMVR